MFFLLFQHFCEPCLELSRVHKNHSACRMHFTRTQVYIRSSFFLGIYLQLNRMFIVMMMVAMMMMMMMTMVLGVLHMVAGKRGVIILFQLYVDDELSQDGGLSGRLFGHDICDFLSF